MAAAKKTNWGAILGVIGVLFVLWLLLTRKAPAAGSSGGGGGLVGGGGSGPFPGQQQQPQGGGGISAGIPGVGGTPSNASTLSSFLGGWVSAVLNQGWANANTLEIDNGYEPGGALDDLSIPYEPTSLFDVSQLTSDIPGYGDNSGLDTVDTDITDGSIDDGSDGLLPLGSYDIPGYDDSGDLQVDDTSLDDAGPIAYDNSGFSGDFSDDTYDPWGSGVTDVGLLS